ncbi:hypothetical protein MYSTI_03914 [Myxococcus stipitatus DSM 14675]|uniref:Lipoprotein n=1 Tax=Myxococcus stipitatus (strain DSM 14675 / JCM 12634 / Mx s8) TaxID=1278073 RepID=L7UBF4_MYXSD|nr:hypothetical protein [Myxococcus stipitatus]AGC45220.1 hypothetical protein MYSTI_03914 [Myxococcus stipitatus DSM 14675]
MRHLSVALMFLSVSACTHTPSPRSGRVVSVAPADLAMKAGYTPWTISMPFGEAEDGSALVLRFLDQAELSGARFVSDMQVVFMADDAGTELECRRRLVPQASFATRKGQGAPRAMAEAPAPLKHIRRVEMDTVVRCGDATGRAVLQFLSQNSPPSPTRPPLIRYTTTTMLMGASSGSCVAHTVKRVVTRYAFEDAVDFAPMRADRLMQARPELRLWASEAECVPRDPLSPLGNRLEAQAYGGAGPRAAFLGPELSMRTEPSAPSFIDL